MHKKLLIAQRKLSAVEERRRHLERESHSRSAEVDAVRAELQPYRALHLDDAKRHEAGLHALQSEVAAAERAASRATRASRLASLRAAVAGAAAPALHDAFRAWATAVACLALGSRWASHVHKLEAKAE